MSLEIPANDHGHIRVFAFNGALPTEVLDKSPQAIEKVFGTPALNPAFIDIIKISDLSSMMLSEYIQQGYDMQVEPHDVPAIDSIEGYAILVLSSAARGNAVTLTPVSGLRHVTTILPVVQIQPIEPLQSDAATGILDGPPVKPKKSDARMSGMIAMYALIAMIMLVGLMVWIAR